MARSTRSTAAGVNIDGAIGFIDPPDSTTLSIATASTLNVINGAVVALLPGILEFLAGDGLSISTAGKVEVFARDNVDVKWTNPNMATVAVDVAWDATLEFASVNNTRLGKCVSDLPISNAGTMFIRPTVHLVVNGHAGGGTGASLLQTNGVMNWWTGSNIVTEHGMNLYSGTLLINVIKPNTKAIVLGEMIIGSAQTSPTITYAGQVGYGMFEVQGDVFWVSGTLKPRLDATVSNVFTHPANIWRSTGVFSRGDNATTVDPTIQGNETNIAQNQGWDILNASKYFAGTPLPDPTGYGGNYQLSIATIGNRSETIRVVRK